MKLKCFVFSFISSHIIYVYEKCYKLNVFRNENTVWNDRKRNSSLMFKEQTFYILLCKQFVFCFCVVHGENVIRKMLWKERWNLMLWWRKLVNNRIFWCWSDRIYFNGKSNFETSWQLHLFCVSEPHKCFFLMIW
jgi:hypothetical protein